MQNPLDSPETQISTIPLYRLGVFGVAKAAGARISGG
jgi:hypothetical protein